MRNAYEQDAIAAGQRAFYVDHPEVPRQHPLDLPPQSFAQVLCWLDDLIEPGEPYPTHAMFSAARKMPSDTSLRDVLIALGADPSRTPASER